MENMKVKILVFGVICFIIFCIVGYKFWISGKNKNIKDVNELDNFILSIQNYKLNANLTIKSNKNSNTYILCEERKNGVLREEINDESGEQCITIENRDKSLVIKNTKLNLTSVFENYKDVLNNVNTLNSFIEDYKKDEKKDIKENKDYYIVSVKCANVQNEYSKVKCLYINKDKSSIERLDIKDINNNTRIIIKYSNFEILK